MSSLWGGINGSSVLIEAPPINQRNVATAPRSMTAGDEASGDCPATLLQQPASDNGYS
ncbi:hypothetical protein X971_4069 [Agrobacterium tumefaciens LBA4213 (Ach5)]|nr:hypothetical protein X971_4069 [Agrobacterium tumefaciens LBA4213 (Ach5)]